MHHHTSEHPQGHEAAPAHDKAMAMMSHEAHSQSPMGKRHEGHDKHAGHSPEMFRTRFLVSLALTLPILYFSEPVQ